MTISTLPGAGTLTNNGSAVTLGQYDISGWLCTGTEWIEMFLLADS